MSAQEPCISWGRDPMGRGNLGGFPAYGKVFGVAAKGIIHLSNTALCALSIGAISRTLNDPNYPKPPHF